jgi:hypothetical protein
VAEAAAAFAFGLRVVVRPRDTGFFGASVVAVRASAWRMRRLTISDGCAPLPIQALIFSVSRRTVAGSVNGS